MNFLPLLFDDAQLNQPSAQSPGLLRSDKFTREDSPAEGKTFHERCVQHLRTYKSEVMGIDEPGIWRGRSYDHILPLAHAAENILPHYREAFWRFQTHSRRAVPLHQHFHHLNSSQAMAINLFFPILAGDEHATRKLLNAMRLPVEKVTGEFEVQYDAREKTCFDFVLRYEDGRTVLFEVKYSENGFGSARPEMWETKYRAKFDTFYRTHLAGHLDSRWLARAAVERHYQILRNISYLSRIRDSSLVFLVPFQNEALANDLACLDDIRRGDLRSRISVISLESLVDRLSTGSEQRPFAEHMDDFNRKYGVL
jgi:hypothetical protein